MAENAVPKFNVEAFNPKKAELASLVEKYKGLKIDGVDDKAGFEKVKKARIELKNTRCEIKNKLKLARDPAIAFQDAVLALEKDLIGIIEPTEDALEAEEKRIEKEKERIKREAEEKELKRLQAMVDKLAAVGYPSSVNALKDISDAHFEELLADVTKKRDEAKRVQEEAAAKAEADRKALAEAQAKLEADQKKLAEEQAKIEADRKINEEAAAKLAEAQKKLDEERKVAAEDERITMMRDTYGIPDELPPTPTIEPATALPDVPSTTPESKKSKRIPFVNYMHQRFAESDFGRNDSSSDAEDRWIKSLDLPSILDFMASWYETTNEPEATEPFDDYDKVETFVQKLIGM